VLAYVRLYDERTRTYQPTEPFEASCAIQVANTVCKLKSAKYSDNYDKAKAVLLTCNAPAKGSGSRSRRQYKSDANGSLFHWVPEGDEVDDACIQVSSGDQTHHTHCIITREKPRLKHSNKEPQNRDLGKILHASKSDSEDTPKQEQRSQPS
jgi:hypothetical protein